MLGILIEGRFWDFTCLIWNFLIWKQQNLHIKENDQHLVQLLPNKLVTPFITVLLVSITRSLVWSIPKVSKLRPCMSKSEDSNCSCVSKGASNVWEWVGESWWYLLKYVAKTQLFSKIFQKACQLYNLKCYHKKRKVICKDWQSFTCAAHYFLQTFIMQPWYCSHANRSSKTGASNFTIFEFFSKLYPEFWSLNNLC